MGPSRHNHRKSRLMRRVSEKSFFEIFFFEIFLFRRFVPSKPHTGRCGQFRSFEILFFTFAFLRSSPRPISIDKLTHHCVYTVNLSTLLSARGLTSLRCGILVLEGGFTLRCLQRLSRPYFASLLCRWHDNSCTRGTSIPVLSY